MIDIEKSKRATLHYWLLRGKYSLIEEPKEIWRRYRPFFRSSEKREKCRYIFMVDGTRPHGGMFDRLKGLTTLYGLAKVRKSEFKIHFVYPFNLSTYLEPNKHDWAISPQELSFSYPYARPLIVYGEWVHPTRIFKRRHGEIHVYYGFDSIVDLNRAFGTNYGFGELYRELFRPSAYLQTNIERIQGEIGSNYIACHIRFTNLLGDKVEIYGRQDSLDEESKLKLMNICLSTINSIGEKHSGMRIMLATDSGIFTQFVHQQCANIYIIPGEIKHVDTVDGNTTNDVNLKLFLDYYLMAGAEQVYSIINREETLYASDFPNFAAKIGDKPFERVYID